MSWQIGIVVKKIIEAVMLLLLTEILDPIGTGILLLFGFTRLVCLHISINVATSLCDAALNKSNLKSFGRLRRAPFHRAVIVTWNIVGFRFQKVSLGRKPERQKLYLLAA